MKPLTVNIPHELSREEARLKVDEGFTQIQSQMTGGISAFFTWQHRWEGDRLQFEASSLGQKLTGRLDVLDDSVRIEIDLPEMLQKLAGRISARLMKTGRALLERK